MFARVERHDGRGATGMTTVIRFEQVEDEPGVRVVDRIERRQYTLYTPEPVDPDPDPADPGGFRFPVDGAVAFEAEAVSVPISAGFVRDGEDELVVEIEPGTTAQLPPDAYSVELNAPVKVYLRVRGPVVVDAGDDRVRFAFDGRREVRAGARSYHDRPAATISVPDDPDDLATALPALASSLKTTSCERSFPTLRGHPPLLSVGEELSIPDRLEPPDTGIEIALPAEYPALHVAAPLVYYLGADVRPASDPRLTTDHGFEHPLDGPEGFERAVERVLEQVFFLDCVTRTEGRYGVDLAERAALESALDLAFESLYGQKPARQVEAYLSVPFERVVEHVPTWSLTAHLPPTAVSSEVLPFVLDDLAVVRTASARVLTPAGVRSEVLEQFVGGTRGDGRSGDDGDAAAEPQFVRPETTGAMEDAWFGAGVPLDATRATLAAYRNRLADDRGEGPADVAVVCNDPGMLDERDAVRRMYGTWSEAPDEVSIHEGLTTGGLAALLETDRDFLHYVGHIDGDGFECTDGHLDAAEISEVGIRAFLLNACQSYRQGVTLVEAGAVGGVVTLDEVVDGGALTIGRTVARLLDLGFPLRAALTIAREESVVGGHYIVVGDGSVDVAQDETGMPILPDATSVEGDAFDVSIKAYLPSEGGMGSLAYPLVGEAERHSLAPGEIGQFRVPAAELQAVLDREWCPVRVDGELVLPGEQCNGSSLRPGGSEP
jgi:hypothetical protein